MITQQLNILIQLATIDGTLATKERKLIEHIAKVNNLDEDQFKELLNKPEPITELEHLSENERFEYLYMVIQLMKVDGQVFKSEIVFCEEIAEKLGYKKKVVAELSKNIYSDPSITADREMLMEKASKFRI
ncbi:MAG: TerB family tellurite resistance protein [Cyclobacteriaceae bacterium]|nr:TerB family tellurite resistance protein [Cyclobacteriaceae bacterium]MCK5207957.1 TerB family tellurite resistance protein [Cyclobacteriaceae bacterium]MCK5368359.1 TerB family tellurite resistance protein [Cyclobacteriaceae bacterium]MCK5469433.1 TerB family tellurite resistance protein [Cyclobacteriaceae bacterium]